MTSAALALPSSGWREIGSDPPPEGEHVLFYWPQGERGIGGIEAATLFINGNDWSYWTHGGPNAGSDWNARDDERPTHWQPLPAPPTAEGK